MQHVTVSEKARVRNFVQIRRVLLGPERYTVLQFSLPIYQSAIVRTIQFQWLEETYVDHCEAVQHKPHVTLLATKS